MHRQRADSIQPMLPRYCYCYILEFTSEFFESWRSELELFQRKRYSLQEVKKKLETMMASNTIDPLQKFEIKHQIIGIYQVVLLSNPLTGS